MGLPEFFISQKVVIPEQRAITDYLQRLQNRFTVGFLRYGSMSKEKKFMTRLGMELKAYKKTGNAEHLYNIGVYAGCETITPENKRFHFDPSVDSVTRGKV